MSLLFRKVAKASALAAGVAALERRAGGSCCLFSRCCSGENTGATKANEVNVPTDKQPAVSEEVIDLEGAETAVKPCSNWGCCSSKPTAAAPVVQGGAPAGGCSYNLFSCCSGKDTGVTLEAEVEGTDNKSQEPAGSDEDGENQVPSEEAVPQGNENHVPLQKAEVKETAEGALDQTNNEKGLGADPNVVDQTARPADANYAFGGKVTMYVTLAIFTLLVIVAGAYRACSGKTVDESDESDDEECEHLMSEGERAMWRVKEDI